MLHYPVLWLTDNIGDHDAALKRFTSITEPYQQKPLLDYSCNTPDTLSDSQEVARYRHATIGGEFTPWFTRYCETRHIDSPDGVSVRSRDLLHAIYKDAQSVIDQATAFADDYRVLMEQHRELLDGVNQDGYYRWMHAVAESDYASQYRKLVSLHHLPVRQSDYSGLNRPHYLPARHYGQPRLDIADIIIDDLCDLPACIVDSHGVWHSSGVYQGIFSPHDIVDVSRSWHSRVLDILEDSHNASTIAVLVDCTL